MGHSRRPRRGRSKLSLVNGDAAGLDVGATFHVVAIPSERDTQPVRTFQSFTADLHDDDCDLNYAEWWLAGSYQETDIGPTGCDDAASSCSDADSCDGSGSCDRADHPADTEGACPECQT